MTRRRWIADQAAGDRAALTGANAAHLARVLRARPGQEFEIAVEGQVRLGRVLSVSDERVEFELGEAIAGDSALPVCLYLAVFKFDRLEWAIEKATELGVAEIVPVIARRTESHLAQAAGKRVERWRRIAHEASQQSRRTSPPEIAIPLPLKQLLSAAGGRSTSTGATETSLLNAEGRPTPTAQDEADVAQPPSAGLRIVLAESERNQTLPQLLTECHPERSEGSALDTTTISIAVGPEGGWTSDELQKFEQAGWQPASLGPRILRAETAALAALAITSAVLSS